MVSAQAAPRAEETAEAPATEAPAEEETLPESEPPTAQEPATAITAVFTNIQIPTWNLGERIPIVPQVWDADTPQIDVGTAGEDVEVIDQGSSEITPTVPADVGMSPKAKRKRKRRGSATKATDGRLVIRLKQSGPAQTAEATEDNERPGSTAVNQAETVQSVEDGAVLATEVADVQETREPVPDTEEVQPTDGVEPFVETVDAPRLEIGNQTPEGESARTQTDPEQGSVRGYSQSPPVAMGATAEAAEELSAGPTVREQATEIMLLLESAMRNVCAWSERIEAQTSEKAERNAMVWKRRLENCEESLKQKSASLLEAEKGQEELRKALEAKDAELAKVRTELEVERRTRTDAARFREELREAQADVKSLRRRNGVLKEDVEKARQEEKRMSEAFEMLNAEMKRSKEMWKRIETRLVADIEQTTQENRTIKQALEKRRTAMEKLQQEKDEAVRCHRQVQEQLGPLRMELSVVTKDLEKARANRKAQQQEIDRLLGELGQKRQRVEANLRRIVERFREQTSAAIQVATATALQGWAEQAAELQVLRADKANRDLRGPGFWKLDQANCEAVQKNLTTDFLRLGLTHREEITKLLNTHDELVRRMETEMEAVAEPVRPASQPTEGAEDADDEEPAEELEPSILPVLTED
jgi:hypothetical protein